MTNPDQFKKVGPEYHTLCPPCADKHPTAKADRPDPGSRTTDTCHGCDRTTSTQRYPGTFRRK